MAMVRSYRRARRDAGKLRLPRSVFTFTYSQAAFGVAGLLVGLWLVGVVGGSPVVIGPLGALVGGLFGGHRRDGREPARWLLAAAGTRRTAWSPLWGRLPERTTRLRYSCTVRPGGEEGWG
jgi:hypothetical protein